ncbi:hypothetical protein PG990_015288 [Apiospora arundinis]
MALPIEQLGLSPVHLRCLDGNLHQVITHVEGDPDSLELATSNGETPLMLASLMGHYEIVQFLVINKSVDISRLDRNKLAASNYAGDSEFARQARIEYVGTGIGREHPLAEQKRREILGLLLNPTRRAITKTRHRQGGDAGFHEFRMAPMGSKIGVWGLIGSVETGVPLPDIKTLGFIMPKSDNLPICAPFDFARHSEDAAARGPAYYATSGWKANEKRNPQVVDSGLWGWVAHKLVAPVFGHIFPKGRDNGNKVPDPEHGGRVKASHVEVVLSTFYAFSLTEALVARQPGQDEESYIREQFMHLGQIQFMNLGARRDMVIHLDSHPCDSCVAYVEGIEWLTELRFTYKGGCGMVSDPRAAKGARFAPPQDQRRMDVHDQLADAQAALARDPALMDGFRYRLAQEDAAETMPGINRIEETPPLIEDDDDDEDDSSDSEMLFTPPPVTPSDVLQTFSQRIRAFEYSPSIKEPPSSGSGSSQRPRPQRAARRPRYTPFIVPNPLDHKPKTPTPVWEDPFAANPSRSRGSTIVESMDTDEESPVEEATGSKAAPFVIEDDDDEEEGEEEEDRVGQAEIGHGNYYINMQFAPPP